MTPIQGLVNSLVKEDFYELWHQHFGHILKNSLCQAPFKVTGLPTVIAPIDTSPCKGCILGKMHNHSYPASGKQVTHPLGLVHTNLVGPMPTKLHYRACYVLAFIDDYSGYALVAFIYNKDATSQYFQAMVFWAKTFTGHLLTSVCSNHGGGVWLGDYNCSFNPEVLLTRHLFPIHPNRMDMQRGSIELCLKKQKPYTNMLVCHNISGMMLLKLHCIFIIDNPCVIMIRRHSLNHSMETNLMFLTLGFLEHVLTFGYHLCKQQQDKLSPKSEEMTFIGYKPNTKGYHFWSKERGWVFASTNAIFNEKVILYCSRDKVDGHTPIPVKDEKLFPALNNLPQDDTWKHRDPEPSQDINVPLPLSLGQLPNQLFPPDDEHSSGHFSPSTTPWIPQMNVLSLL